MQATEQLPEVSPESLSLIGVVEATGEVEDHLALLENTAVRTDDTVWCASKVSARQRLLAVLTAPIPNDCTIQGAGGTRQWEP